MSASTQLNEPWCSAGSLFRYPYRIGWWPVSTYLQDLRSAHARCRQAEGNQFELFLHEPVVSCLWWPSDVVRQMLWEHGETEHFMPDYGTLRLEQVSWTREAVSRELLRSVPTGRFDHGAIEDYAKFPDYWAGKKGDCVKYFWPQRGD